jgi:hypothetical protein
MSEFYPMASALSRGFENFSPAFAEVQARAGTAVLTKQKPADIIF